MQHAGRRKQPNRERDRRRSVRGTHRGGPPVTTRDRDRRCAARGRCWSTVGAHRDVRLHRCRSRRFHQASCRGHVCRCTATRRWSGWRPLAFAHVHGRSCGSPPGNHDGRGGGGGDDRSENSDDTSGARHDRHRRNASRDLLPSRSPAATPLAIIGGTAQEKSGTRSPGPAFFI